MVVFLYILFYSSSGPNLELIKKIKYNVKTFFFYYQSHFDF